MRMVCPTVDDQVVLVRDVQNGDQFTRLLGDLKGFDAFASAVCDAVVIHCRSFAVTVFRDNKDVAGSVIDAHHADDFIVGTSKRDPLHTHGGASHRTCRAFVETNGLS